MSDLTVVFWLWEQPGYAAGFTAEHVNIAARMVERNLTIPHRFLCITDTPEGVEIPTFKGWGEFTDISTPMWEDPGKCPQSHRRIKLFDPDVEKVLGKRFVTMDLDMVVLDNLDGLFSREEDFVITRSPNPTHKYVGSMWMMDAGARSPVYDHYNQSAAVIAETRFTGSDQAWINYCLSDQPVWGSGDGVLFFHPKMKYCPRDFSVVFFNGELNPWSPEVWDHYDWVRDHYY